MGEKHPFLTSRLVSSISSPFCWIVVYHHPLPLPFQLSQAVNQLVSSIASKPRVAIDVGKRFFYQQLEKPYAAALDLADYTMAHNIVQKDTEEGIAAFVEKRKPDWDL